MMVSRSLLVSTALLCFYVQVNKISATTYTMFVNGQPKSRSNDYVRVNAPSIVVSCRINPSSSQAVMESVIHGQTSSLGFYITTSFSGQDKFLNYTRASGVQSGSPETYRCREDTGSSCPAYVQVTLYSSTRRPTAPTIANCPPGGTPVSPSNVPSTRPSSSGGTSSPNFAGLNPLIYTISAVVLLGTLAIVAIITCWIRARRSYNRRMFQTNTDPQDYLDYISDNEFTPLTTSEFVASLQERPPTYHESEEIEGQMRQDDSEESTEGSNRGQTGETGTTTASGEGSAGAQSGAGGSTRTPPSRPPPPTGSTAPRALQQPPISRRSGGTRRSGARAPGEVHATTLIRTTGPGSARPQLVPNATSTQQTLVTNEDGAEGSIDTGVSSDEPLLGGVDALLSLDMGNGNETLQQESHSMEPLQPLSVESSAAVATLIDLDFGETSNSGSHDVSDSQSTVHTLPQPTPEQISEIEAAIGAINKHMTEIRERTE